MVSLKIDEETLEILNEYAEKRGTNRSEIIREAIREYINKVIRPELEKGEETKSIKIRVKKITI